MNKYFITLFAVLGLIGIVLILLSNTESQRPTPQLAQYATSMNLQVLAIFNYTIKEDDDQRTLHDIEVNGGDCFDYTRYYENLSLALNITGKRVATDVHIFYLIYDDTGHCILDQRFMQCFFYRKI